MRAVCIRAVMSFAVALVVGGIPTAFAAGASSSLIVGNLGTREGLPQGTVYATLRDSQGFVWFGTEDGLVRYDGYEVFRYAYSPTNRDGLPGNFVLSLTEDRHRDLWIGIKGGGVARWDRATDKFTVFRHSPAQAQTLGSDAVRTLMIDSRGLIWVGTFDAGIDIIDPVDNRVRHLVHDPGRRASLADNEVLSLMEDSRATVWIGTHAGLDSVHLIQSAKDSYEFVHHPLRSDASTGGDAQISQVAEDADGSLWVGTFNGGGLYHVDRDGAVLGAYRHDAAEPGSLASDDIHAVLRTRDNNLWVGTAEGLDLLKPLTRTFEHYRHDKTDPDSLADSFIMSLYQDAGHLLWIGTLEGGVSRWNPHSWELGGSRPSWLEGKLVTSFADGDNGELWIGSLGGGLKSFNPASGTAVDVDAMLATRNAIGDARVMSLLKDRRGELWIGTMTAGLKVLSNGAIRSIGVQSGDSRSVSAAGIMNMYEARDGRIWIGTHGGGANVLNPTTGLVQQLPFATGVDGAVSSKVVTSFVEDEAGFFWIGTEGGGLDIARPDGRVIKTFRHDPKDPASLSADTVYSLTIDRAGTVWVATAGGGLERVSGSATAPQTIQFTNLSHSDGLLSDTVYGVLADAAGQLWLSGNAGLARYDPATRILKTYHREQGLQSEEFNFNAYFRSRDGRLCFGGPGGLNVFDPSRLSGNGVPPRVALTHFEVLGAPVVGPTPVWLLDRAELDYRAAIVSFDFAALDFTSPGRNRLAYRMRGLTEEWIDLGALRRVTLTNLEPGNHVLEVRAQNSDSIWSTAPLRLTIHKAAAPWRSQTAYAGYAVVLMFLIGLGIYLQRQKWRAAGAARQRLESEVALRTRELRDANHQLVVASEAKNNFLARMGHELRTPMNGVVGMTELLARTTLSKTQAAQTQTIKASAQTLLRILNDLLDLSKAQVGKIRLEHVSIDVLQLCEECTTLFSGAAAAKNIDLIVCPPPDAQGEYFGDPFRIRQILMNLIGNAVKFTEKGQILIKCERDMSVGPTGSIRLMVKDTGIGISEASIATVFDPFTQADETTTRRYGGTGLGLAICQELVQLMGGTISVSSKPGDGSCFDVLLPLDPAGGGELPAHREFGKSARVVTRQSALRDAMTRYLRLLGVECLDVEREATDADFILLDVDTCSEFLDDYMSLEDAARVPIVLVVSNRNADARNFELLLPTAPIIRKPMTLEPLRDAIDAALDGARQTSEYADRTSPSVAYQTDSCDVGRGHVLVVEDEPVNAAVAQGYLAELGCSSCWVADGGAVLERTAAERFGLVLMDLDMPGVDGYRATHLIRNTERDGQHLPIVALTANDAAAHREACLKHGMDDILSKPYTLAQLEAVLQRWLATSAKLPGPWTVDAATVDGLRSVKSRECDDLYFKLVGLFEQSSRDSMCQLERSLAEQDCEGVVKIAHKFKSAAANVGALQFAALLKEIETAARSGALETAHEKSVLLRTTYPQLLAELLSISRRSVA